MFDVALFILFCVMSYRIARGIQGETAVLKEFGQPKTLGFIALLFPLGPLILTFGNVWMAPAITLLLALGCYVPALVMARRQGRALEESGTDRVQRAQSVISQAFGTALIGLAYIGVAICLLVSVSFIT